MSAQLLIKALTYHDWKHLKQLNQRNPTEVDKLDFSDFVESEKHRLDALNEIFPKIKGT